jgi:RNA polymerase sigma factor (TIGR02999 family)
MMYDQSPGHTLQPTALVNEAYLRMLRQENLRIGSRAHFFRLAAKVMRQVLVDYAREKHSLKRGGDCGRVTLDGQDAAATDLGVDIIALDDAVSVLASLDERKGKLVELRVFGGMTLDEAADALGIARSTAALDWRFARSWLRAELGLGEGS